VTRGRGVCCSRLAWRSPPWIARKKSSSTPPGRACGRATLGGGGGMFFCATPRGGGFKSTPTAYFHSQLHPHSSCLGLHYQKFVRQATSVPCANKANTISAAIKTQRVRVVLG
jgi:hypothetical protein